MVTRYGKRRPIVTHSNETPYVTIANRLIPEIFLHR